MPACGPERSVRAAQRAYALPPKSDVHLFCYRESVVELNAEISNGALDLSMPQKKLYGSQVAGSALDQGRLGPAKECVPNRCGSSPILASQRDRRRAYWRVVICLPNRRPVNRYSPSFLPVIRR